MTKIFLVMRVVIKYATACAFHIQPLLKEGLSYIVTYTDENSIDVHLMYTLNMTKEKERGENAHMTAASLRKWK